MSEKPIRRERLCELFWEVPDDPRGALRWSLSKIRGIVNSDGVERLKADRNVVQFVGQGVEVDGLRFLQSNIADMTYIDAESLASLEETVDSQGFIEDLALHNCPAFEAWRASLANEIETLQSQFLRNLIDFYENDKRKALHFASLLHQRFPELEDLAAEVDELRKSTKAMALKPDPTEIVEPSQTKEIKNTPNKSPAERPQPGPMVLFRSASQDEQSIRYCTTNDGTRLAYCTTGTGPTVVRVGHWMTHLEYELHSPVWHHWIEALQAKTTLVRYDMRGWGLSDWDAGDYSLERQVSDLESIMDVVGHGKVILFGYSQSCPVAITYAARHPERVSKLLLYAGFAKGHFQTTSKDVRKKVDYFPQ